MRGVGFVTFVIEVGLGFGLMGGAVEFLGLFYEKLLLIAVF
jgi:hypothetical protein